MTYPELRALNIMHLASPNSAILSAVIFNALIIVVPFIGIKLIDMIVTALGVK